MAAVAVAIAVAAVLLGGGRADTAWADAPATPINLTPRDLEPALAALRGADLVAIDDPTPGRTPSVLIATRVAAPVTAVAAVLCDPRAYREAIPSLVRADVLGRRPTAGATAATQDQLLQWEVEIPLFNLKGKAWVSPRADGVDIILSEGDLAPGRLSFTWAVATAPGGGAGETILMVESQANMRAAGWLFRRIASRSPFGEGAMNAAAAYVVVRAAAAYAQHPHDPAARRPQAAPEPPALAGFTTDAVVLGGSPALAVVRLRGTVAAVRRAAGSGRLIAVAVAAPVPLAPEALTARLAAPDDWRAFPGWHRVKPLAGDRVAIDDNLPLVDFDAVWQLRRDRRLGFSAVAVEGATRGALFGWDVYGLSGGGAPHSLAVLSLYPRLEAAGYIPRTFIAAEPLLEPGIALALAYVDALSMARALSATVGRSTAVPVTR